MKHELDLFISTGEVSGDLLASSIVKNLSPDISIGGITGPSLRQLGIREYFPMELFEIHGLTSLIKGLPRVLLNYRRIKKKIIELNPKVVLLVDNVGFSLSMASSLRKCGFKGKIVQLVCPTVWAWRKGRMKNMIKNLDLVLSLFPFEEEIFSKTPLAVKFIGHPLLETLNNLKNEETEKTKKVFLLFPGSRKHEIKLNFPMQLRAAKLIQNEYNITVSAAKPSYVPLIQKIAQDEGVAINIAPSEKRHQLMKEAELALAKCGTTIFELGIIGTPTIVMYKMSRLDLLGAFVFKIFLAHYSLPNILLGKRAFPEYVGTFAKQDLISSEVLKCAREQPLRNQMRLVSDELRDLYQTKNASKEAAVKIHDLLFNSC